MKKRIILLLTASVLIIIGINACKHEPPYTGKPATPDYGGFPDGVGKILTDRCASAGCHNAASYSGAGGLLLDSWEHLFDGSNNGAAVVAYSPEFSPLMYFINTDTLQGPTATPVMPDTTSPGKGPLLTQAEYETIRNWIAAGAPDKNGNIPFASNADTRQKIYLTQQGCDLVAVIDAEKKVVMRYIKVGAVNGVTESPHCIRVSPDAQNAYVCFTNGNTLQKINTSTDQVVSSKALTGNTSTPQWNILFISPDNSKVMVCDFNIGGGIVMHNASSLAFEKYFDKMDKPHGVTCNASFDTLYISSQLGNTIYKRPANNPDVSLIQKISLTGAPAVTAKYPGSPDPHEVMMVPDGTKYIVTCEATNEVKVVDAHTNVILKTFTTSDGVGIFPQEIAISKKQHLAYISCQDKSGTDKYKGSVFVFNYDNLTAAGSISANTGNFSQPHGITVDDRNDVLYVASINADGPAPHHATSCGGRAGYYKVFNSAPPFNALNGKTYQVTVAPYSADVRFKN